MGTENFELKPVKVERRESAEMMADIEAVRVAAEDLRNLESDEVVFKNKAEAQPFIDAYEASLDSLDSWGDRDSIMIEHKLHVFPGSSRMH